MLELRWLEDQASLPASDLNGANTRGFGEGEKLTIQIKGKKKGKKKSEKEKSGKGKIKRLQEDDPIQRDRCGFPSRWLFTHSLP